MQNAPSAGSAAAAAPTPAPHPAPASRRGWAARPVGGRVGFWAGLASRCAPGGRAPSREEPRLRRGARVAPAPGLRSPPAAPLRGPYPPRAVLVAVAASEEPSRASPGARKVKWKQCEIHQRRNQQAVGSRVTEPAPAFPFKGTAHPVGRKKKIINKWQRFARPDHLPVCTPADARGVDAFLSLPPPPPLGAGLAQCSQGERSLPTLILGRCPGRERFCGRVSNPQPTNFNTFRWWGNVKCIFCSFSPRLPRMIKLANQKRVPIPPRIDTSN